jgi:hypothetical protein
VTAMSNGDGAGICSPSFLYLEAIIGASYSLIFVLVFFCQKVC